MSMSRMRNSINDATPADWNRVSQNYLMKPDVVQATTPIKTDTSIRSTLTEDPKGRKQIPMYTTLIKYFPMALAEVAECCVIGGAQHGQAINELHWDRSKSGGELDALMRHLVDAGYLDTDGVRHSAKIAFRALANLELELEAAKTQ